MQGFIERYVGGQYPPIADPRAARRQLVREREQMRKNIAELERHIGRLDARIGVLDKQIADEEARDA